MFEIGDKLMFKRTEDLDENVDANIRYYIDYLETNEHEGVGKVWTVTEIDKIQITVRHNNKRKSFTRYSKYYNGWLLEDVAFKI